MLLSTSTLVLAALGTAINAQILADRIQNKRTALAAGGWALVAPGASCPSSSTLCDSGYCCPTSLTCVAQESDTDNACCAGSTNCISTLQTSPACADNSWSLWNATQSTFQYGYFCCLATQAGLDIGGCIEADQVPAYAGQLGALLSSAAGGSIATTAGGSVATTAATTTGAKPTTAGTAATGSSNSSSSVAPTSASSAAPTTTSKPNNAMSISTQGVGVIVLLQGLAVVFVIGLF